MVSKTQITLEPHVLDRLVLAKQLLLSEDRGLTSSSESLSVAEAVLAAHDAAELATSAIADALGCATKPDKWSLMHYIEAIEGKHSKLFAGRTFFSQLNLARNGFKHHGNRPDAEQFHDAVHRCSDYISQVCSVYLDQDFERLDTSALLFCEEARQRYKRAREHNEAGAHREALEEIAYALQAVCKETPLEYLVTPGVPDSQVALELAGYGVHPGRFIRLQQYLPSLYLDDVQWNERRYGHAGNWTHERVSYCLDVFLEIATKIQKAKLEPHAAEYHFAFLDRLTCKCDHSPVYGELSLFFGYADKKRISLGHLDVGQQITGNAIGAFGDLLIGRLVETDIQLADVLSISRPRCPELTIPNHISALCVRREDFEIESVPEPMMHDFFPHLFPDVEDH